MNSLSRNQIEALLKSNADDLQIAKTIAIQSKPDQTKTLVGGVLLAMLANVVFPVAGPLVVLALTADKFMEQRRMAKAVSQKIARGEVWDFIPEADRASFPSLDPEKQAITVAASTQAQDEKTKATPTGDPAIENRGNGADIILGDLVNLMVHEPKPTIISAVPRTGKGYLVNQVIERFKVKGFTVWVLQPKPAPAEFAYWKCADRFLGIDLENYQRDSEGITEVMQSFFFEWRQQNTSETPSILVIDELVKIQALMPKFYRDFLIPQCIVEGSSGETAGRYLYLLTQSPLVSDLGMSGGNRSTFEFIGLEKATSQNHAESIKKSVSGLGELPSVESYAKSPVGTLAYYSRLNGWVPMPQYAKPTIGPGDVLCPELDELVNQRVIVGVVAGQSPIGTTPTMSKAPTKLAPDLSGCEITETDEFLGLFGDALAMLKEVDEPVKLTHLVAADRQRRKHGKRLIDELSAVPNVEYSFKKIGNSTSHYFQWVTDIPGDSFDEIN